MNKEKIIIIGGGFAGISVIKNLKNNDQCSITLVDRNNYNFFPPLLYQAATGFLEPSSISYPFRKLLRAYRNVQFRMAELVEIKHTEKKAVLSDGELEYDTLIIAAGLESNYFGIDNIRKNAIPMKTLEDALNMRNILLQRIEKASILKNKEELEKKLSIVIAGGGPTGIEVAGMLAEMRTHIFPKDYPELKHLAHQVKIYLIAGAPALLMPMSVKSQQYTLKSLEAMGITVLLHVQVSDFDGQKVTMKDGSSIETESLIWAAGVTGQEFLGLPPTAYGAGKRLLVDEYNELVEHKGIFAIGDACLQLTDKNYPNGHPQMAQPALQQGLNLANNLKAKFSGKPLIPFRYKDRGSMAIIGANKAVADLPGTIHVDGFMASFMWIFVHLMSLVNYRNRIRTLYNWGVAYMTKDLPLRMIIRPKR